MKRKILGVVNSDSMDCNYGGVTPFIRNMHPELEKVFEVRYYFIPKKWKNNFIPGRILILIFLILHKKDILQCDFILSHIPEGSWLIGHWGIPYSHIFHGNSNPMEVSKWKFGKLFLSVFTHFNNYIYENCPLIYSVGEASGRAKKIFNPINQNVQPLPYDSRKGLFFAGRLERVKNIDRLIRIYSLLPEEIKNNTPFFIAGSGTLEDSLKEEVNILHLKNNIHFVGSISNDKMLEFDADKQILIMASSTEGFPSAIAEALSVGVPVISTSVGDIPLIIKNGEQGFLFDASFDDKEYAKAICNILSNYEHFASLAFKSATIFNASNVTKGVIRDIQNILNSQ